MPHASLPLRVAVFPGYGSVSSETLESCRRWFGDDDELQAIRPEQIGDGGWDLVVAVNICGPIRAGETLTRSGVPVLPLSAYGGFHPYQAGLRLQMRELGTAPLPFLTPAEIRSSVAAVRAAKEVRNTTLLVASHEREGFPARAIARFAEGCHDRLGLRIVHRHVDELKERAGEVSDAAARAEWDRWRAEVISDCEMDEDHMMQVVRLYLAEKAMLDATGAAGITVADIKGFLTIPEPEVMPNVTYGALAMDGILACEEGDIEALASECLLRAALGTTPTMSNIYLAFRDRLTDKPADAEYDREMELADCLQCFEDNRVTISHFSSAGIIPPDMMEEDRYRVRETVPAWKGQSMVWSTPKLGPVMLARLSPDASAVHCLPGEADSLGFGDDYGWYRGRWFVKLPSVRAFAETCLHHHYSIGLENDRRAVLETLLWHVFNLQAI